MKNKTGLEYFSFDVDFFQDEKTQFVSARFGMKGEIVIIKLLCKIYRQGYYIDWNDDIALLFAKSVGGDCQYSFVNDVVCELLKRGFFDKGIFERFSVLTSRGIQKRYFEATGRRKKVEAREEILLIEVRNFQNVYILENNVNNLSADVDILKQSKVKERKGKERKVKESKGNSVGSEEPPESFKQSLKLSESLLTSHRKEYPDFLSGKDSQKTIESWAVDIEKLIRIDKKTPENIQQVIYWIKTKGNFWFPNIISGKKLREKYETVWAQMQSRGSAPKHRIGTDNIQKSKVASYFKESI